jgi:hypothetical protein
MSRAIAIACAISLAALFGCNTDTVAGQPTSTGGSSAGGATQGGGGSGGQTTSTSTSGAGGLGGNFGPGGFTATPVRELPGLNSITFHERTGGTAPTPYEFTVNGPELTVRLDDPLTEQSHDIPGASTEYYDVYYSDEDGIFELDGSYLTISGAFEHALPAGGGLNLAEIGLNFADATTEYGNYVASYVVLGDNSAEANVAHCIDSDLQTHTTMGNTVGASERLRLTLGFESTSGPPPR